MVTKHILNICYLCGYKEMLTVCVCKTGLPCYLRQRIRCVLTYELRANCVRGDSVYVLTTLTGLSV